MLIYHLCLPHQVEKEKDYKLKAFIALFDHRFLSLCGYTWSMKEQKMCKIERAASLSLPLYSNN